MDLENLPLRAFVLGRLPEHEAASIAAAAQGDVELADAIRAVEAELFDELAAGRLDGEERAAFDARFGAHPDTRRRLASARAFARLVDRHAQGGLEALIEHAVTTSGAYARMPLPSSANHTVSASSSAVPDPASPAQESPAPPTPASPAQESPGVTDSPALAPHFSSSRVVGTSPLAPLPPLPTPPPAQVTPLRRAARTWSALAVALAAGLGFWIVRPMDAPVALRLEPAVLRGADDTPEVRLGRAPLALELALDEPRAPGRRYDVRVVEARGAEVWRTDAVLGEALRVRVTLPSGALAPGRYVVHLTEGAFERVYPLEVVRVE